MAFNYILHFCYWTHPLRCFFPVFKFFCCRISIWFLVIFWIVHVAIFSLEYIRHSYFCFIYNSNICLSQRFMSIVYIIPCWSLLLICMIDFYYKKVAFCMWKKVEIILLWVILFSFKEGMLFSWQAVRLRGNHFNSIWDWDN